MKSNSFLSQFAHGGESHTAEQLTKFEHLINDPLILVLILAVCLFVTVFIMKKMLKKNPIQTLLAVNLVSFIFGVLTWTSLPILATTLVIFGMFSTLAVVIFSLK